MTELPPTEEETLWKHNWLYSVLPTNNQLYLCGYCRACDNAFAKIIPHAYAFKIGDEYDLVVTKMDIPKWGCVDPTKL